MATGSSHGIAPTSDWRKPLTVSDWHQEFLTGLAPPVMGKWGQNSCCYLWQCFLALFGHFADMKKTLLGSQAEQGGQGGAAELQSGGGAFTT